MARRRQRVHLIVTLVIVAIGLAGLWWHSRGRAIRVHPPAQPREVTVQALWYSPEEGGGSAGTSRVVVRVEPNDVPGARVGFFEDEAQGTGETWRASAWMATVVASLTAGINLQRYVPSFTVEGRIDGPSAGGLLTVAILADLTNRTLRPDATLTGTIGPDGAIGPVGGLSHKVEAAAGAGLKLVLIPKGQSTETDPQTGKAVDVVECGRRNNVEVREVADVTEAYELLAGRALPQPEAAGAPPKLADSVTQELTKRAGTWLAAYAHEIGECDRLRERLGQAAAQVDAQAAAARKSAQTAEKRLGEGNVAVGYDQAVAATLQAAATADLLKAIAALGDGGVSRAAGTVAPREDRDAEIGATAAKLSDLAVDTVDGLLATADAFGTTAQASGLLRARKGLQSGLAAAPGEVGSLELLLRAAALKGMDRHILEIAQDRAMLVASRQGPRLASDAPLSAWAVTMQRAAEANLAYFQAVALDETARAVGVHPDVLRSTMEYGDPTYLLAQASLVALPDLEKHVEGKVKTDAAVLGTSVGAYAAASAIVSKFYSLRVQVNRDGEVVGVADTGALDRLVASASARALRDIAGARAVGLDASIPSFYYLIAGEYASGDTDERLEALQCYWQASLYARIGALLAG
jgi:uncharacterized protein